MTEGTGPAPSQEQEAKSTNTCVCGGKGPMLSQMLDAFLPSGAVQEHFKNARLELLKGFRELLDQRIQSLSHEQRTGTKLNVE